MNYGALSHQLMTTGVFLLSWIESGVALLCYNCSSIQNIDCGPLFKKHMLSPVECEENATICALQRQPAIRAMGQVGGILRGCYIPGQLDGLNHSDGCRSYTTGDGFSARYCFCAHDMCNSAEIPNLSLAVWIFLILLGVHHHILQIFTICLKGLRSKMS